MIQLLIAGGWLMVPILLCSVAATAIVIERFWALRPKAVMPEQLVSLIWTLHRRRLLTDERIAEIRGGSALGRMLAAGLVNRFHSREVMKEAITDTGRQVVADLERYLNALSTIAAVSPLLGLLGTVFGMIDVFAVITTTGVGDASVLAGGISKALITTAAGLMVAIPALMFHRYFDGRVNGIVIAMEEQALRLIEMMKGEREPSEGAPL